MPIRWLTFFSAFPILSGDMFRFRIVYFALALCLVSAPASGLADPHEKPQSENSPPASLQPAKGNYLRIPRESFGQRFLMSISVIPQSMAATSTGLAGKIVTFELFADGVDLFEDPEGLVVTDDLPVRRLVASFPIVEENKKWVTIDFNKGMRRAFADIWYSISRSFDPFMGEETYEIPGARVFEVSKMDGQVVIRQSAQVRSRQFSADMENRYEIRYFIKPYQQGDYQGKEYTRRDDRYVRFFETAARLEKTTGRPSTRIARFDLSKPLKFYYSSNTPKAYEEAVKGGIEYWNRAFGRKVIEVDKAPEGITAPSAGHNIVQWVPWDNAGFAYADILVDPITGESQRGQAYMTSVFAISGKASARRILRRMRALAQEGEEEEEGDDPKDGGEKEHGRATFWPHSKICHFPEQAFAKQYAEGLEAVLAHPAASDEMVLQMSQDYVRAIVAHEVGHVLGLRHNFAGSLDTTVSHERLEKWLNAYLKQEDLSEFENDYTANSIMEYQVFVAQALTGAKMRSTETVLPHDRRAILWGYYDDREVAEKKTLYAADRDTGTWDDVNVFDYGADPVVTSYAAISDAVRQLPNSLIEQFIRAKAPRDPRDQIPLEEVNLSFSAAPVVFELRDMLQWFGSSARSLTVERQFDFVGPLNRKEVQQAHWKRLNEQIESLGGIDRAIFSFLPEDLKLSLKEKPKGAAAAPRLTAESLNKSLKALLESPAYQKFVGLDDKEYEFTEEERKLIAERATKLFAKLSDALVLEACNIFASARRDLGVAANEVLADDDIVSQLEKRIIEFAEKVILAKDKEKTIKGKIDGKASVEVTGYKYTSQTRLAAARMLSDSIGSYKSWSKEGKSAIHKKLKGEVEDVLLIKHLKSFKDSMLSRSLRKWYLDQQEILRLLPAIRSSSPPPSPPPAK